MQSWNRWDEREVEILLDYMKRKKYYHGRKEFFGDIGQKLGRSFNSVYAKINNTDWIKKEYQKQSFIPIQEKERLDELLISICPLKPDMLRADWYKMAVEKSGISKESVVAKKQYLSSNFSKEFHKYEFKDQATDMKEYEEAILDICVHGEFEKYKDMVLAISDYLDLEEKQVRNFLYNRGYALDPINELRVEAGSLPLRTPRDGFSISEMLEVEDLLANKTFDSKPSAYKFVAKHFGIRPRTAERKMVLSGLNNLIIKE